MGKKSHSEVKSKQNNVSKSGVQTPSCLKLPPNRRNDLNQLLDKILKVSSSVPESASITTELEAYFDIQKITTKVKALEEELLQPLPDRKSAKDDFLSWLRNNKVEFDGLRIVEYPGLDFGIEAEKDFKEGDMMIAVPRSAMLTVENIHNSPLKELAKRDPLIVHMPNVALALLLLLHRRDPESFWKPYINMLPSKYTTVLYFSPEEVLQLKGSPAFEMALRQCRSISRQYAYFSKLFQRSTDEASNILREVFTFEEYW
ncbi:Actin-histidine N-methyltransferase [Frankliniella fusca]|uniref:protein-histidine N-methyltransferase n=1 Tax=Frankliniella fusca TaxID=407009 RepID=A0AAE1LD52_9NEOP|nr:Actin-histidine N-methyltransferase [Frankliniella fusca]